MKSSTCWNGVLILVLPELAFRFKTRVLKSCVLKTRVLECVLACFGDLHRVRFEYALSVFWESFESILVKFYGRTSLHSIGRLPPTIFGQLLLGPLPVCRLLFWIDSEDDGSSAFWECVLSAFWVRFGCFLSAFWVRFECVPSFENSHFETRVLSSEF